MFALIMLAIVSLGCMLFIVRWSLSPPRGPLDGTVRVLASTLAGGLIAFWVLAAAIAPQLNRDARQSGIAEIAPTTADARSLIEDIQLSAPIGVDIATGIGAGVGFFIALASVGSYRRVA